MSSSPTKTPSKPAVFTLLVFATMLSSTLLIPVARPFFAALHGDSEAPMHAFMSVNMLGAIIGAPMLSALADRTGHRRLLLVVLAALDGLLLLACTLPVSVPWVLAFRTLQGAANVGGLSILLGGIRSGSEASHGKAMGMAGAAMMAAVAMGAPLGTILLAYGPVAPLWFGGLLQLAVAVGAVILVLPTTARERGARPWTALAKAPLLKLPTLWIGAERFTVGCFVVTFQLYAHHVLDISSAQVGVLFSWFLLPFALATYPLGRLAERVDRAWLVACGTMGYGCMFLILGHVAAPVLPLVMFLAGLSSAAIYAPSLCYAAALPPESLRTTSMSLVNAGGALGMMLGTALAGALSGALLGMGWARGEVYPLIFSLAGAVQILVLLVSTKGLRQLSQIDEARAHAASCPVGAGRRAAD